MDNTHFFSTGTITVPIGFRLFNSLYRKQSEKYSDKCDRGLRQAFDAMRLPPRPDIVTTSGCLKRSAIPSFTMLKIEVNRRPFIVTFNLKFNILWEIPILLYRIFFRLFTIEAIEQSPLIQKQSFQYTPFWIANKAPDGHCREWVLIAFKSPYQSDTSN